MEMSVSCAICYCSYDTDQDKEVVAIKCGHTFHKICLLEWKNSSRQMTCPECRTKYSVRALKKLYLNIMPKDEAEVNDNLNVKLVQQTSIADELKVEQQRIQLEKNEMEYRLMKSRDEFRTLLAGNETLKQEFAIKCQAYSMISDINDQYLTNNDHLKDENRRLKRQVEQLQKDLIASKAQQLKTSKPFVDLTADDQEEDSDLEIIETETPAKRPRLNLPESIPVVIALDDEPEILVEVETDEPEIVEPEPAVEPAPEETGKDPDDMKNPAPSMTELQSLEQFIIEQM